ncbi:MAG: MFS transporter [Gammaproteobacteria bacterium]|nr:MAG: MFS transporter [Gammaproteobacteria bacterium]
MFDFANSGYTTVVLTAVYNVYFVSVIAGGQGQYDQGAATFLWTIALAIGNALVLFSAPVIGAIADFRACKKRFLLITTIGCVSATALLATTRSGDVVLAMTLIVFSSFMFATGEGLIAAFLPELAPQKDMGRISGYGWTLGYLGGLLVLGLSLAYVTWARQAGHNVERYIPVTMLITAAAFAVAATPTFLWLRERAQPQCLPAATDYVRTGFSRLRHTLVRAHHYRDLFHFLITLTVFYCGIYTVIVLAAVYAQQVMDFTTQDTLLLVIVVNITAALGALMFGYLQDRFGSVKTLFLTLLIWLVALIVVYASDSRMFFWVAANLIGIALGSSQSAGRALVGQFSPPERSAEFFGLWTLATRVAAIIGPLSYGFITYITHGDHRMAILSTTVFFIIGLLLLLTVDEARGKASAYSH